MLSDEEKEALRNFKSEYETCDHYSSDLIIELDDAEIILNLIEKQSKDIEELILDLEEMTKSNNHKKENWVHKSILNSYVSKDKIEAKIEEYDDKEMTKNLVNRSAGKTFQQAVHYEVKKVLQSLLEKE